MALKNDSSRTESISTVGSRVASRMVLTAAKKWRGLRERKVKERLLALKEDRRQREADARERARVLARKIPVDVLAREWLNETKPNVETRAYLLDKLLPTLILAVEKLLTEVSKRKLEEHDGTVTDFNPVNYLAQYLMRNNPRFVHFSDSSPYTRGIRAVAEELKNSVFALEENRLAKVKAETRRKREERKKQVEMKSEEAKRRRVAIAGAFGAWTKGDVAEMTQVQAALRSFQDMAEFYPEEMKKLMEYNRPIEDGIDSDNQLDQSVFVDYLYEFVKDFPPEVFDTFTEHLISCGHHISADRQFEKLKSIMGGVFSKVDVGEVGLVDRLQVLKLLERFYEQYKLSDIGIGLRDPTKWPVVEIFEQQFVEGIVVRPSSKEAEIRQTNEKTAGVEGKGLKEEKEEQVTGKQESKAEEQGDTVVKGKDVSGEIDLTLKEGEAVKATATGNDGPSDEKMVEGKAGKQTEEQKLETQGGGGEMVEKGEKDKPIEDKSTEEDKEVSKLEKDKSAAQQRDEQGNVEESSNHDLKKNSHQTRADRQREKQTQNGGSSEESAQTTGEDSEKPVEHVRPEKRALRSRTRPTTRSTAIGSLILETPIETESGPGSIFDPSTLNESQFVQLLQTFLGEQFDMQLAEELGEYLAKNYGERDDQREKRRSKSCAMMKSTDRQNLINGLFSKWDRDCSGFLEMDELQVVLRRWKGLDSREAKEHVREVLDAVDKDQDQKLSHQELQAYIELLADEFPGDDDAFEEIVQFLTDSVEQTYEEQRRGEARTRFLDIIRWTGKTSGVDFEPLYRAIFSSVQQDAEEHGGGKIVSARIGILEMVDGSGSQEEQVLHYVAATLDDKDIIGRKVNQSSRKISFAVVESGKPIHIPKIGAHGGMQTVGTRGRVIEDVRDGSLVLLPLKNPGKRVIGLMAVDTFAEPCGQEFASHEINFYQGVARALSISYIYIDIRLKVIRITQSAIAWIHRRCPSVVQIAVYLVEPTRHTVAGQFLLRKMLSTDPRGESEIDLKPSRLARKDNLFRDYLFKCVDHSETVTAVAYGHRHIAFPLRNSGGYTMFVLDINIGQLKALPQQQNEEMSRMLKLLTMACAEVSLEVEDTGDPEYVLEAESASEDIRISVLFDRLILMELRENVEKLRPSLFSELKSYVVPPAVVHCVIQSVLVIFAPERKDLLSDWNECKQLVSPDLLKKIAIFDPTASSVDIDQGVIMEYLKHVPHGEVMKHGSKPAELLYNWLYVCLSLIEHTVRMRRNEQASPNHGIREGTDKESIVESTDENP